MMTPPLGGDGTTWSTAFRYLQDALPLPGLTDQIHIAGGIYTPDRDEAGDIYPGDREAAFHLINGVDIYGGYRGCPGGDCESGDPNERDLELYETILSGDLAGDDVEVPPVELPDEPTRAENSYHVFHHPEDLNLDHTAVLDGVTITGGNADGSSFPHSGGGGMYNHQSSPTMTACKVSGNSANHFGGGMLNGESSPTVTNCTFSGNCCKDGRGGGGMHNSASSPTVSNCTFSGNSAAWGGGGMFNYGGDPTVTDCTFSGNWAARDGGGMYNSFSGDLTATNCILWGNLPDQISSSGLMPTVRYSNVQGGYEGEGNIDADPMFVDPGLWIDNSTPDYPNRVLWVPGDLRLLSGSPCIDAGDNDAVPDHLDTDLDGNPRFVDDPCVDDSGNGEAPVVDMGAYERQVPPDCGNGVCDEGESCETCPCDCGECYCGDGWCTTRENCLSCPDDCECRTLHVPDDFETIQRAIYAARDGDEIIVAPGTYYEAIDFLGKAVALRSSDGPGVTTIDATGREKSVVRSTHGEDSNTVLDGFTITGGTGTWHDAHGYGYAGGGMYNLDSSPTVTNCVFSGNSAVTGGGMYNQGGDPTLTNCTFSGNSADYYGGGGMYNHDSNPTLTNCTFSGNSSGRYGGGMYNYESSPTVRNCVFSENAADRDGGGMRNCWSSAPTVTNCIFSENAAGGGGGGMLVNTATVSNCILWGNVPDQVLGSPTIQYSNVQGGYPGEGNLDADPLFVPGPGGCYYLSQIAAGQAVDSPCVDAGSDLAENLGLATMTTRADEGGDAGVVDMGYHHPVTGQPLIMGDFNRDGSVDLADFGNWIECMTDPGPASVPPCCRIFDFGPDTDVDLADFAVLQSEFNMTALGPSIAGCQRRSDDSTTRVFDNASPGPERK